MGPVPDPKFKVCSITDAYYRAMHVSAKRGIAIVLPLLWLTPTYGPSGALSYHRSQQQSLTILGKVAVSVARDTAENFLGTHT